jgi:hypothetical protein
LNRYIMLHVLFPSGQEGTPVPRRVGCTKD